MGKLILNRALEFSKYFDVEIYSEIKSSINNDNGISILFEEETSGLKSMIKDLSVLDHSAWKLMKRNSSKELLKSRLTNTEKLTKLLAIDCYSILDEAIGFNPLNNICKTIYYWQKHDYKADNFYNSLLNSKGENYTFQRYSLFQTIEEIPLKGIDLLLLNIKKIGSITGQEILHHSKSLDMKDAKDNLVRFLAKHIVYHNSLVFKT